MSEGKQSKGVRGFISSWWHHLKWHIAVWPAMGLIGFVLTNWLSPYFSGYWQHNKEALSGYAGSHPARVLGTLLVLAVIGLAIQVYRRVWPVLVREKRYALMLEGIGLREFSPHDSDERRTQDWDSCLVELNRSKPNVLCILGATGWETFGSPQSPLHDLLKHFQGRIHILLLKPDAAGFKKRTADLNRNEASYADEISSSVDYCKTLKGRYHKNIELKLYEDEPIWKMIFSDQYLWLQYYDPARDVDDTPVYTLQTRGAENQSSLYYPLIRVFERRWKEASSLPVKL